MGGRRIEKLIHAKSFDEVISTPRNLLFPASPAMGKKHFAGAGEPVKVRTALESARSTSKE